MPNTREWTKVIYLYRCLIHLYIYQLLWFFFLFFILLCVTTQIKHANFSCTVFVCSATTLFLGLTRLENLFRCGARGHEPWNSNLALVVKTRTKTTRKTCNKEKSFINSTIWSTLLSGKACPNKDEYCYSDKAGIVKRAPGPTDRYGYDKNSCRYKCSIRLSTIPTLQPLHLPEFFLLSWVSASRSSDSTSLKTNISSDRKFSVAFILANILTVFQMYFL